MVSSITISGLHLGAVLACILYLGRGLLLPQIALYSWATAGPGRAFEFVGRLHEAVWTVIKLHIWAKWHSVGFLVCLFLFGILEAMNSSHICFQVTLTRQFTTNAVGFLLNEFHFCLRSFSQSGTYFWNLPVSPDQQWTDQHHKCFVPWQISALLSLSHTRHWRQNGVSWLMLHSKCGLIKAFKNRGIDGLSHSQLPKNLSYILCVFPGSLMPRRPHLWDEPPCWLRVIKYIGIIWTYWEGQFQTTPIE